MAIYPNYCLTQLFPYCHRAWHFLSYFWYYRVPQKLENKVLKKCM